MRIARFHLGENSRGLRSLARYCVLAAFWGGSTLAESWAAAAETPPGVADLQRLTAALDNGSASRGWKYIVLHHSATEVGSVESIDAAHRQRLDADGQPWRGIGYHFVVGNGAGMTDGEVAATFRWREQCDGAHAGVAEFNQLGVGICLIGDFESARPTAAQLASAQRLIHVLRQEYGIAETEVLTHRDLKPTACPGGQFPLAEIRAAQPTILRASQASE